MPAVLTKNFQMYQIQLCDWLIEEILNWNFNYHNINNSIYSWLPDSSRCQVWPLTTNYNPYYKDFFMQRYSKSFKKCKKWKRLELCDKNIAENFWLDKHLFLIYHFKQIKDQIPNIECCQFQYSFLLLLIFKVNQQLPERKFNI